MPEIIMCWCSDAEDSEPVPSRQRRREARFKTPPRAPQRQNIETEAPPTQDSQMPASVVRLPTSGLRNPRTSISTISSSSSVSSGHRPGRLLHDPQTSNTNNARSSHWRMTLSQTVNSGFSGTSSHRQPAREGREGVVELGAVGRTKAGNAMVPGSMVEAARKSFDGRGEAVRGTETRSEDDSGGR